MSEQLRLNYQEPIFGRYGLVGHGCWEYNTLKIDGILLIPNQELCTLYTAAKQ